METGKARSFLIVLNDAPYGIERSYNGLRLSLALNKWEDAIVRVFMTGDGVSCARAGQKTPDGYYNIERMVHSLVKRGAAVAAWGVTWRLAGTSLKT
jgi:uncharacterized protein involved in oxidation of intracellular sulfur